MRFFALILLAAAATTAGAQNAFPLGDDDSWTYIYVLDPPSAPPDTTRFAVAVTERLVTRDTAYVIARFPAMPTDTLRADADGRVWGRVGGRDALILDLTRGDGEAYVFSGLGLTQTVTVRRPVTERLPAGRFETGVEFSFDDPSVSDDEFSVTVVPGVGIVRGDAQYRPSGWLEEARVGGRGYTPAESDPVDATAPRVRPNPFASATTLDLPTGPWRRADVFDVLGRRVARLDVRPCVVGPCALLWDATGQAPGRYVIRVEGERQSLAVPVVIAR